MTTAQNQITIVSYDSSGNVVEVSQVNHAELDETTLQYFSEKLLRLSGDLELPLEGKLPGDLNFIEFRIGSDMNAAYVMYYLHDEVVFASLCLRGRDELSEMELSQVFKFLLLDTEHADEPTEEEIEAVLSASAFDFAKFEERPIVHAVAFSNQDEEAEELEHIESMNCHLCAAFIAG